MIPIDRIQARRDALQAQFDEAEQTYNQLETTLHTLDRQLCAMRGGLQALDALLAMDSAPDLAALESENGHGI